MRHNGAGFDEAFRRLYPLAHARAFRRVGSLQDAEEMAQDVMAILGRRWATLSGHENLEAWVNVSTDLHAKSYWRKVYRRRKKWDELIAQIELDSVDDSDILVDRLSALTYLESLGRVLRRQNPLDREMLLLRFVEGYTTKEIQTKLGLGDLHTASIDKRITRILARVRRDWLEDTV